MGIHGGNQECRLKFNENDKRKRGIFYNKKGVSRKGFGPVRFCIKT